MTQQQVIISVAEDADLSTVAGALRNAGMTVSGMLDGAGVITGTADSAVIAALSAVPGVTDVEYAAGYQLPPPDSPVQ